MANLTAAGRSKLARARFQGAALPATLYFALVKVDRGLFVGGATYAVGNCVIPSVWAQRIYRVTAITTGVAGTEPAWPTVDGGTVTSGGVTLTEQSLAMLAGTWQEADFPGYARATMACNAINFSEDGGGNVNNLTGITFGSSNSGSAQLVAAMIEIDSVTGGNTLSVVPMTYPQHANVGASAVITPVGSFTFSIT